MQTVNIVSFFLSCSEGCRNRAEYGFGEYGFKHRTQWVFRGSLSSGERAQWVPLSPIFVCQRELTEFFAEVTEFAAELSEAQWVLFSETVLSNYAGSGLLQGPFLENNLFPLKSGFKMCFGRWAEMGPKLLSAHVAITHINCLGIGFPFAGTSGTQNNSFRSICVIISGIIVKVARLQNKFWHEICWATNFLMKIAEKCFLNILSQYLWVQKKTCKILAKLPCQKLRFPWPQTGPESPFSGKEGFGVQKFPFPLSLEKGVFGQKSPLFCKGTQRKWGFLDQKLPFPARVRAEGNGGLDPETLFSRKWGFGDVTNRQNVSKSFSTLFDHFRAGQKRQKVFRHFSTIFAQHHFSGPFWEALKYLWVQKTLQNSCQTSLQKTERNSPMSFCWSAGRTPSNGPKVQLQGYGYNPFCSHSSRCLAVLVWQYFEEAFCAPKVRLKWYGFKSFPSHNSHCSGGLFPQYSGVSPYS